MIPDDSNPPHDCSIVVIVLSLVFNASTHRRNDNDDDDVDDDDDPFVKDSFFLYDFYCNSESYKKYYVGNLRSNCCN
jgi:hypothetical protein